MDSFSVETTFTAADWQTYQAKVAQRLHDGAPARLQTVVFLGGVAVVALLYILSRTFPQDLRLGSMVIGLLGTFAIFYIRWWLVRREYRADPDGITVGPRTLIFAVDGITIQRSNTSAFFSWSVYQDVEIDREHLYVWLDRLSAVMVPLRDLPSGMTVEQVATRIRALASNPPAAGGMAAAPAVMPTAASSGAPVIAAGPSTLRRAIGFLTLRPVKFAVGAPSDWAIAGFTAGSLVLWLVLDRLRYGRDAEFVPYDAPGFAWYMLPVLLASWLTARLTQPRVEFRQVLFLLVVAAPLLIGCSFVLSHNTRGNLIIVVAVALVAYAIAYLEIGLRALAGKRQRLAVTAIISISLVFVALNSAVFEYPTLWSDPEPDGEDYESQAERAENLLILQGPRIEAEVARVVAAPADRAGVYFVGFAGVGRQRVFSDEIKLAAQRISDRYAAAQRIVLLLNDRRDLDSHPLATVEGLKLALRDVAARMDVEKDVLFLALSSHGDDEPSLSVSNTSVSLRDLSGADLAEALRASGIKWKVIVISACHAGAFISALRDDNSAIFTAAAADRTSFGCSDDRELTYFGEAFYRDALPRSATLQEAFSGAEADIASREEREHVRASNPQSFIGPAIRSKLDEIDSTARCNTGCKQSVPESQSTRP